MSFSQVLTGTLMLPLYEEQGLAPENLSRNIADVGTLSAPLIPWNGNAIYVSTMLAVSPLIFIPFSFFNIINILLAFLFGLFNISIKKKQSVSPK